MTERNECTQTRRRKSFALSPEEKFRDERTTVVCHNRGDRDSLLFGNLQLDDRDRYDGWGVSATREEELTGTGGWTTYVDDYQGFHYLRHQEDLLATSEAALEGLQEQMRGIEAELTGLRDDAREMKRRYGSIEPSVIRRGQYLAGRLTQLSELRDHYQYRVDTARDNLRRLETLRAVEPDEVDYTEGYNTTHWNQVYRSGEDFIHWLAFRLHKISTPKLARIINRVQHKRSRREVTFEHYVQLVGVLNGELHRRTGAKNFLARRERTSDPATVLSGERQCRDERQRRSGSANQSSAAGRGAR